MRVPEDRLEFQILYGMSEPIRNALLKEGLRLRLYSPIGELMPGMAYLVSRLLENTSNESFLRKSFSEHALRDELLRSPGSFLTSSRDTSESSEEEEAAEDNKGQAKHFKNVPPLDWTLAEHRDGMAAAIKKVRGDLPIQVPLHIAGNPIETPRTIQSINPNQPDEIVGHAASATANHAEQAIAAAKYAFVSWRDTTPVDRAACLFRAAEITRKLRYELCALEIFEAGKTWSEADGDVCEAIDFLEYYGREILRLGRPQQMGDVPGEESLLFYEPHGVVSVIAPWNLPLAISMGMTAAALVTGNTVVYKPASDTPITGSIVYRVFSEAGLPAGVLNYLPGPSGEIGEPARHAPRRVDDRLHRQQTGGPAHHPPLRRSS